MKRLLLILIMSLTALLSWAQDSNSSGFDMDNPEDVAALKKINAKMNKIRRHRPTVALVLGGGGAKGAAHIGTIKALDSLGIPVDMVLGTSVGGLVGGFYALGYTPELMDSLIRSLDWSKMMSDKIPREYIPYERVKYKEKYALSFPFFYNKKDYQEMIDSDLRYISGKKTLNLSADASNPAYLVKENLLGSLPSGYITGQNVRSLFASTAVGYTGDIDFLEDLPIPFVCVATDIVTGKAKVWHKGNIVTALRSTMSIPFVFTPVREDGMVLVDGGMRNNFPTDLAAQMGADIIIGVDLSNASKDITAIRNVMDIFWQSVDMLSGDSFARNIEIPDVTVKPDLTGFNMLSFDRESIDTIFVRGYKAAREKLPELEAVRRRIGRYKPASRPAPATDINITPVKIEEIEFTGVTEKEKQFIISQIGIRPGDSISREDAEKVVAFIYGTTAFDNVSYSVVGSQEPYKLKIDCKKGPVHELGLGLRVDTEELVNVLVNVGLWTNSLQGSSISFTGKIGPNPYLGLEYKLNSYRLPTLHVATSFKWVDRNNFSMGDNRFNLAYMDFRQEVFFSSTYKSKLMARYGVRNDLFYIDRLYSENFVGDFDLRTGMFDYITPFVILRADDTDKGYFPTRGRSFGVEGQYVHSLAGGSKFRFGVLSADGKIVVPIGKHFTIIPSAALRFTFGKDIPVTFTNVLGGQIPGRYIDQQLPFIGLNNAAIRRDNIIIARADLRYRFFRNNFITATVNYAHDFDSFDSFENGLDIWGWGLEYAYNSIVGPLRANVHYSTLTRKVGVYFSVGFDF